MSIKSYIPAKLLACEVIIYFSSALKCVNYTFPKPFCREKKRAYSRQVCILINTTCWDKNRNVRKYEQVSLRIACIPILLLFIKIFISLMNYKTSSLLSRVRFLCIFPRRGSYRLHHLKSISSIFHLNSIKKSTLYFFSLSPKLLELYSRII